MFIMLNESNDDDVDDDVNSGLGGRRHHHQNIPFWQLKCLVTLLTYRRYTNIFIYLSIYLSICISY